MGLRNWLEETSAQLNMRDGGKTASTVRQQRARTAPATLPGSNLAPQAQAQIQNAKYGVLANNPTKQKQFIQSTVVPKLNIKQAARESFKEAVPQVGTGIGLGAVRAATGLAQDVSGLYDLASRGTGTSRVSKGLDTFAKSVDQTAQAEGVNGVYKAAQVPLAAATYMTPGAVAKGVSQIPKVASAVRPVANMATRAVAPVSRLVDRGATNLATRGAAGRIAAPALRGVAAPNMMLNAATGTALDLGSESGRGRDISGTDVALSAGMNVAGGALLSAAPQAALEGARAVAPTTRLIANKTAVRYGQARNNVATDDGISSQQKQLSREAKAYQQRINSLPADDFRSAEVLQRKIDRNTGIIQQLETSRPQRSLPTKAVDKVLTAQPGMSMKAVNSSDPSTNPELPPVNAAKPEPAVLPTKQPEVQSVDSLPNNNRTTDTKLNIDRLNIDDDAKTYLSKETQETVAKLSNDDVQKYAKSAGIDTKSHTPEQTRAIIAKQLNTRSDAVKFVNEAKAATDVNAKAALLLKAAERGRTSREQGTDIARQLQARKIIANELDSPEQRIFKLLDQAGVNPEVYTRRLAEVDFVDTKAVVKAYREMVPAKAQDWLDTLRYNSMLSSPLTQAVNVFGNAQNVALVAPVEKTLRGAIDVAGGLFGKERQYAAGEGAAYAGAVATNITNASRNFVDALRNTGKYANPDFEDSIPLAQGGVKGATYNTLSAPMKVLDGMDKFFRTLSEAGEEAALNTRVKAGIKLGGNREALKKAEADYRVFQTELGSSGQGILNDSFDEFAKLVMRGRNSKNPIMSNIAKFTVPFVKTVNNINKQGIVDYSPLGFANLKGNADKTTAVTRAIMGSAVFGTSAALLAQGQMTWSEPRNADERARFRAEGKQPYAIKFGDKWYNFSKLTPSIAFPMAMTAALDDAMTDKKLDQSTTDKILEAVSKYGNFMSDQSYAKGIGDTLGALGGDKEAVAQAVSNNVQQVVPFRALTGWVARITDDVERKVDTSQGYFAQQVESLMQQYPGLRDDTNARTYRGEPIAANKPLQNGLLPVRVTKDRGVNPIDQELDKIAEVSPESFKLDKAQQSAIDKIIKPEIAKQQKELIANDQYKQMSPTDKKKALNKVSGDITAARKAEYMAENQLGQWAPDYKGKQSKLSASQKKYLTSGTMNVTDDANVSDTISAHSKKVLNEYSTLTAEERDKKAYGEKDYDYKVVKSKFENDVATGKLSRSQKIDAEKKVAKSLIGSKFSKDTREFYGLSKEQLYDLVNKDGDGNKIVEDVLSYGDALVNAKLIDKNTFRDSKGRVAIRPKAKGSGSGRSGRKIDFSLYSGSANPLSLDKSLRKLLEQSRLKA